MNNPPLGDSLQALSVAVLDAREAFGMPDHRWPKYSLHTQAWPGHTCGWGWMGRGRYD